MNTAGVSFIPRKISSLNSVNTVNFYVLTKKTSERLCLSPALLLVILFSQISLLGLQRPCDLLVLAFHQSIRLVAY